MSKSRIGKLPIKLPQDVDIIVKDYNLEINGNFGKLSRQIPENIKIKKEDRSLHIVVETNDRKTRSLHGLYRTLINNMVIGVSKQFKYTLKLVGVGYRCIIQGKNLILNLGYSHPVELLIPDGVTAEVIQTTTINLVGCDNEILGLFAAKIRAWRIPEPYKGKGISYEGEIIKRKAGKSGKK